MKHVTYYLLVSISFPYIHTRQIGHDEGPQLLVIGELEWETQGIRGLGWAQSCHIGAAWWHQSHPNAPQWLPWNLLIISIQTHTPCLLNPRTTKPLVLFIIKQSPTLWEIPGTEKKSQPPRSCPQNKPQLDLFSAVSRSETWLGPPSTPQVVTPGPVC